MLFISFLYMHRNDSENLADNMMKWSGLYHPEPYTGPAPKVIAITLEDDFVWCGCDGYEDIDDSGPEVFSPAITALEVWEEADEESVQAFENESLDVIIE